MKYDLKLSDAELKRLDTLVKEFEKDGPLVCSKKECSYECKRWDCSISCYCANCIL